MAFCKNCGTDIGTEQLCVACGAWQTATAGTVDAPVTPIWARENPSPEAAPVWAGRESVPDPTPDISATATAYETEVISSFGAEEKIAKLKGLSIALIVVGLFLCSPLSVFLGALAHSRCDTALKSTDRAKSVKSVSLAKVCLIIGVVGQVHFCV